MANVQQPIHSFTGNESSSWYKFIGPVNCVLSGTFDTSTTKVQRKNAKGNAVDVTNASFTAATDTLLDYPADTITELRWTMSGAGTEAVEAEFQGMAAPN